MQGRGNLPFLCSPDGEIFLLGQRHRAQLMTVETGDGKLGEVNRIPALIGGQQADTFPAQHLAEKHLLLFVSDLSLMMHAAHRQLARKRLRVSCKRTKEILIKR